MADKTFIVRFKQPDLAIQPVVAERAEFQAEHLVLIDAQGRLAALFVLDVIESWSEVDVPPQG